MKYLDLETEIEITFQSEQLDMLQIGYLNLHLHRVINKLALDIIMPEGSFRASEPWPVDANDELVLVRGVTFRFENGSLVERIRLKIAAVLSPENLKQLGRDLAINIASSLIIAAGGVGDKPRQPQPPTTTPPPIIRVTPDVNRMVEDLAANGGGSLTYRSFEDGKVETEVTVEIPNREKRARVKE